MACVCVRCGKSLSCQEDGHPLEISRVGRDGLWPIDGRPIQVEHLSSDNYLTGDSVAAYEAFVAEMISSGRWRKD